MANFVFSEEAPESLRPFIPEIISPGGGIRGPILSLLQEKHFENHDDHQSLNCFSFILVDHDEVDTTLKLSTAVSKKSFPPTYNPIFLQKNSVNPDDQDYEVDTALSLSRNVPLIYDPVPLRCFPPQNIPESSSTNSLSTGKGKRKRVDGDVGKRREKRSRKGKGGNRRGKRNGEDDQRPLLPSVEEFPALMQTLESRKGSRAVFLYRKKLSDSDVRGDLDRLFVTGREPLFGFLTAEEAAAVDTTKQGIKVLGVDQCGRVYGLVLKMWGSLEITVINAQWNELVAANGARKDDLVEIWGFREEEDGKLGFAVLFGR